MAPMAGDIYQNLLRIRRYESKDTTYKFALLRGLIEISSESPHIKQEADFYGAMDGSSKFVRGDAIAGIIITIVNVVGGLFIGIFQRGFQWILHKFLNLTHLGRAW